MKWTMDDFLSGNVDVVFTHMLPFTRFMIQLDRRQVKWLDGSDASGFIPGVRFPIYVRYNFAGCKALSYGMYSANPVVEMKYYQEDKNTTSPTKKYKVEIECDGTTTTAKLIVDGNEVKSTTAKKHPDDKFNLRTGMETAFGRLWDKKEADPTPAATESTKEDSKLRFKVGDRVIYNKSEGIAQHFKGKHGRIVKACIGCAPYDYGVEFDEPAKYGEFAHNCTGHAKMNHGLWVHDYALTPEPPKEEIKPWGKSCATGHPLRFHEGDRVVLEVPVTHGYNTINEYHGLILKVEDSGHFDYAVQFDRCILGKGFYIPTFIDGKPGHCLWVDDGWLSPEPKTT